MLQTEYEGNVKNILEPVHLCFQDMDEEDILVTSYRNEDENADVFHDNFISPSDPHLNGDELSVSSVNDTPSLKAEPFISDSTKISLEQLHKKANIPPLVLIEEGNYNTPFQFDRQAPARISTSPTLRRLRKNTIGNFMSLQDVFDVSKFPIPKEECVPDNVSCVSQSLEDQVKSCDHEVDPADHTNYTDDEKSPDHNLNGITAPETKGEPEISNQCAQMKAFHQSRQCERRRSSVVLSIPGLEVFPGDLLVSDGASDYMYQAPWLPNSDAKKPKWPFSKKASFIKGKQKQSYDLESCLSMFKVPDFTEYEFYNIKDKTWDDFRNMQTSENKQISSLNRKRQESIWELFTSECTYFLEHLLVLKMIFLHALKHLQNNDYLLDVDPVRLFANLEELNQESLNFATSMLYSIKSRELGSKSSRSLPLADLLTKSSDLLFELHICYYLPGDTKAKRRFCSIYKVV